MNQTVSSLISTCDRHHSQQSVSSVNLQEKLIIVLNYYRIQTIVPNICNLVRCSSSNYTQADLLFFVIDTHEYAAGASFKHGANNLALFRFDICIISGIR